MSITISSSLTDFPIPDEIIEPLSTVLGWKPTIASVNSENQIISIENPLTREEFLAQKICEEILKQAAQIEIDTSVKSFAESVKITVADKETYKLKKNAQTP